MRSRRVPLAVAHALATLIAFPIQAQTTGLTISPSQPQQNDPVYVSMTHELSSVCGEGDYDVSLAMDGQTIEVTFLQTRAAGSPPCLGSGGRATAQLGPLPPGDYVVNTRFSNAELPGEETGAFSVSERSAPEPCAASFDTAGFWWDIADPGWSLSRIQMPSGKTATLWAAFDEGGEPLWFALLPPDPENECRSPIVRVEGGTWFGAAMTASGEPTTETVGSARFSADLLPPDQDGRISRIARFEYTLFGVDGARVVRPADF